MILLTVIAIFILMVVAPLYLLLGFYAAVMNFKRAKDLGTLNKTAYMLGFPYYITGMFVDIVLGNWFAMTIIMLELPRWKEFTTTARLTRLVNNDGYRGKIAKWMCFTLLDSLDPSGKHCK